MSTIKLYTIADIMSSYSGSSSFTQYIINQDKPCDNDESSSMSNSSPADPSSGSPCLITVRISKASNLNFPSSSGVSCHSCFSTET